MPTFNHTPGPWVAEECGSTEVLVISQPGSDGQVVVNYRNPNGLSDEDVANARLMAAAPDLFEAFQPVVKWGEAFNAAEDPIVTIELSREEFDAIRAAIAKVKGGAQ